MGFFKKSKLKSLVPSSSSEKKKTILIVDDEALNLQALSRLLAAHYHVLTATNGRDALELVKDYPSPEHIELIISDQRMPELTGVEFLEKTLPLIPNTIRMILTGFTDVDSIIDAINKGQVYKFILKPFEPNDLLLSVQRALETYDLEKQNKKLVQDLKTLNADLEKKIEQRTEQLASSNKQLSAINQELTNEIEMRKIAEEALQASYQTIKRQQSQIHEQLSQARETQESLLPKTLPKIPGAYMANRYIPVEQIGGDFFNVFSIDDHQFGFIVADVTGHGVPAALVAFLVSGMFFNSLKKGPSPLEAIRSTNGALKGRLPEGKFASMFYAVYDSNLKTLTYTSAGHPPLLVFRKKTAEIFRLKTPGLVIGILPNGMAHFEEASFQCQPGDTILFYTDGITELQNPQGQILSQEGLCQYLRDHQALPLRELLESLCEFGNQHTNYVGFEDDITLIGLEILP